MEQSTTPVLSDDERAELESSVIAGVGYLQAHEPGWFDTVESDMIDEYHEDECVLGQLQRVKETLHTKVTEEQPTSALAYTRYLNDFLNREGSKLDTVAFGFQIPRKWHYRGTAFVQQAYAELTRLWKQQVKVFRDNSITTLGTGEGDGQGDT